MKIIIFLVLAGLSLAQEDLNCPEPPIPKDKKECTLQALKGFSNFSKSFKTFICEYKGTFDANKENHAKAARDLIRAMACSGCGADDWISQSGTTFEEIYKDTGRFGTEILTIVNKIADVLGLTEALTKLICDLAGDALASECLEKILMEDTDKALHGLNDLFCKNDLNKLTAEQIIDLLVNFGCFADDALHTKETLKTFLKALGEDLRPALIDLLKTLKDLLIQKGIAGKLVCDVTKFVLGEKPAIVLDGVLGGGAGGPLDGLINGLLGGGAGGPLSDLHDVLGGGDEGLLGDLHDVPGGGDEGLLGDLGTLDRNSRRVESAQ
ncbi:uncharacterized protein LOC130281747 isoform X2 [Hyla sarda]|uniref:uncharacterized protein LOC130281747 isoform X2 n=1 Tax=Hyla sarda TaxID=327740 RepID=UPI0024C254F3|nr:uncharacterized protein LOC130281747 isoform X2 [Hyla sarda]